MKVLIDTCIIIDTLQRREPFHKESDQIFILAANKQIEGYITAKAITDIHYICKKYIPLDKLEKHIKSLFVLFKVLDTKASHCLLSFDLKEISDYEDSVMTETALDYKLDCIVTRNGKDYKGDYISVYSPEELIEIVTQ